MDQHITEHSLWESSDGNSGNSVGPHSIPSAGLISSRGARVETGLQKQVVWPHTRLEGRHNSLSFEKLNFPLLIIGELGIVKDQTIGEAEKLAHIKAKKLGVLMLRLVCVRAPQT